MKYSKTVSPELKDILKACTNVSQRHSVASKHQISIHTLNSVIEGKRNVTINNQVCVTELMEIAINNAKNMHYSLLDYYHELNQL